MDHIFLDTNIFIRENFLHGKKINSLLNLSEKKIIQLYITEITYNELKANFEKFLTKATSNHNRFRKDSENWILQNDKKLQDFFVKIDATETKNTFNTKLDDLISKSIIKIIPYKPIDIKVVFDKYFKLEPPFGKADKKSEFPDAFTLELLEDFCKSKQIDGIVFSTDKDFLSSEFSNLDIRENYQDYLETKYTEMQLVKKEVTEKLFISKNLELENKFVEWYKDYLIDDHSLYFDAVNWKEVYDVEVEEVLVGSMNYTIVEIIDDIVTLEINTIVKVKVNVLTDDDEYMYYDSDDKSYHYYETNYETFEKEFDSSMIVYIEIVDEDEYSEFAVESINDDKEISFKFDYDF